MGEFLEDPAPKGKELRKAIFQSVGAISLVLLYVTPLGQHVERRLTFFHLPDSPWSILIGPIVFAAVMAIILGLTWISTSAYYSWKDRHGVKSSRSSQSSSSATGSDSPEDSF